MLLAEATDSPDEIEKSLNEIDKQIKGKNKKLLLIINKTDSASEEQLNSLSKSLESFDTLFLSALKDDEINPLSDLLLKTAEVEKLKETDLVITNARHFEALTHSSTSLNRVIEGIESGLSEDLLSQDIRECLHYIGEITGEVTTDEVLGNIFRNFCIGK